MIISLKKIIATIALMLCGNIALAYNFRFSNVTERVLVICYKLEGLSQEYYQIIPPDQSVSYYFPNWHCFGGSILWAEYKAKDAFGKNLPFNGGADLVDELSNEILNAPFHDPSSGETFPFQDSLSRKVRPATGQELFKAMVASKYAFIPMQIKVVDNETFQMTVDAAEQLSQGLDSLACETINTIKSFTGVKAAENASSSMGGMGSGMGKSSMESSMGNIGSSMGKSAGSAMGKALDNAAETLMGGNNPQATISAPPNYIPLPPAELSGPPSDMPPTPEQHMEQGILTSEGRIAEQMDLTGNINTHMATSSSKPAATTSKECRFGLGSVAKGGATLAGVSLCKDLHFVIVDTGEVGSPAPIKEGQTASRVKKPILIAEINQGG